MTVLLDTCALLALARGDLPPGAARALAAAPEAGVSVVSAWEVAIKVAAGKVRLAEPPMHWFLGLTERYALRELTLDARTTCAAAALPRIHADRFDRVIVALAQAGALTVLTSDTNIARYPSITTRW